MLGPEADHSFLLGPSFSLLLMRGESRGEGKESSYVYKRTLAWEEGTKVHLVRRGGSNQVE